MSLSTLIGGGQGLSGPLSAILSSPWFHHACIWAVAFLIGASMVYIGNRRRDGRQ